MTAGGDDAHDAEPIELTTSFDPSVDRPSDTVIRAVAVATDSPPTALTPLATVLDPDALDTVFRTEEPTSLRFHYGGFAVHVTGTGTVRLSEER